MKNIRRGILVKTHHLQKKPSICNSFLLPVYSNPPFSNYKLPHHNQHYHLHLHHHHHHHHYDLRSPPSCRKLDLKPPPSTTYWVFQI
ncbi:hypothetical protein HanOQP8_Chr10g0377641 [Helianthus annuus]|nr:hypothetical protein HanOQP8_Chr10g0377641 [Helianthus annuus]